VQHEELRQLVLDEICSYLRRPYDLETTTSLDPEREIRAFALEILERRLKRKLGPRNYWSHTRLVLENAVLPSVDFSDCRLRNADFTGVRFLGDSTFERVAFQGTTWFDNALFAGSADFNNSVFDGDVWFDETVFKGGADFGHVQLIGDAHFERTRFADWTSWAIAQCNRVMFDEALFEGDVNCEGTVFHGYTDFSQSAFRGRADFGSARFDSPTLFKEVEFGGGAVFTDVCFDWANFERSTFVGDVIFYQALFKGHTVFRGTVCLAGVSFLEAHFREAVDFDRSAFLGEVVLRRALFGKMLFDQALPGNYRAVAPSGGRKYLYWTVGEPEEGEPTATETESKAKAAA